MVFAADGYFYQGKHIDTLQRTQQVLRELTGVHQVVVVPYTHTGDPTWRSNAISYADFLGRGDGDALEFAQLPFDHPLYIVYSSGTTGPPKCIAHGAGGTLIQHLKELVLHTDLKGDDTIFYYTTCGWMMWNWLVSALAIGATVVLYDGSPFFPRPDVLFDLAAQEGVTVFGTSGDGRHTDRALTRPAL